MTRLRTDDIGSIAGRLEEYDRELRTKTGRGLLGVACHAYRQDERAIRAAAQSFSSVVVPVTAGLGIIGNFSDTVSAILHFIGIKSKVAERPDTSGIALAFEQKADFIFTSDDDRFVGLNLLNRAVADNSEATGKVFAAALDLMAGGIRGKEVLVLGCGPVGAAAAGHLLLLGAQPGIYDLSPPAARSLVRRTGNAAIQVETDLLASLKRYRHLIDATPSATAIPDNALRDDAFLAAPGVPLGISAGMRKRMAERLIHDKLELGVAAMAISLLSSNISMNR